MPELSACQHDLADAGAFVQESLFDDFVNSPRQLASAYTRHNAEGANVVATFLDLDEGAGAQPAEWGPFAGSGWIGAVAGTGPEHRVHDVPLCRITEGQVGARLNRRLRATRIDVTASEHDRRLRREAARTPNHLAGLRIGDMGYGARVDDNGVGAFHV
jgi:hypothetical protein